VSAPADSAPPPEGKAPVSLPQPAAIAGAALMVSLFAIVTVILIGVAAYFAFVQHLAITQSRVWAALLGAAYFGWRAGMMFGKYRDVRRAK
jgi:hypothetical protein